MAWKHACKASDIPAGSLKKVWVEGIALVIANFGDGYRAFPPVCPHMEEPLEQSGVIAGCTLTCTKHLWSWDLKTLARQGETEKDLQIYQIKLENGEILAFVDKELVYDFEQADDMDDDDFFKKS